MLSITAAAYSSNAFCVSSASRANISNWVKPPLFASGAGSSFSSLFLFFVVEIAGDNGVVGVIAGGNGVVGEGPTSLWVAIALSQEGIMPSIMPSLSSFMKRSSSSSIAGCADMR